MPASCLHHFSQGLKRVDKKDLTCELQIQIPCSDKSSPRFHWKTHNLFRASRSVSTQCSIHTVRRSYITHFSSHTQTYIKPLFVFLDLKTLLTPASWHRWRWKYSVLVKLPVHGDNFSPRSDYTTYFSHHLRSIMTKIQAPGLRYITIYFTESFLWLRYSWASCVPL